MLVIDQRYKASEAQLRALRALEELPEALNIILDLAHCINDESATVANAVREICPSVFNVLLKDAANLKALHGRLYDVWEIERKFIDEEMERV